MKQTHELKIELQHLKAKLRQEKLFEIRLNDRGYQKGDIIEYIEEDGIGQLRHTYEITYVTNFRLQLNYVVFGERHIRTKTIKYKDGEEI